MKRLDKRIMIQRPVRESETQEIESYEDWMERWARIEPLNMRETFYSRQVQALATHRITIRYVKDLSPTMRCVYVEHGNRRTFEIESIRDPNELHEELELMVVERRAVETAPHAVTVDE